MFGHNFHPYCSYLTSIPEIKKLVGRCVIRDPLLTVSRHPGVKLPTGCCAIFLSTTSDDRNARRARILERGEDVFISLSSSPELLSNPRYVSATDKLNFPAIEKIQGGRKVKITARFGENLPYFQGIGLYLSILRKLFERTYQRTQAPQRGARGCRLRFDRLAYRPSRGIGARQL